MAQELSEQSFRIERHGEIAVVIPTPKVEEMHEALIDQAAIGSVLSKPRLQRKLWPVIDQALMSELNCTFLGKQQTGIHEAIHDAVRSLRH